jgi:hypothetical protein
MGETNIIIYQTEDGVTKIETRLENETVWLSIDQMSELFQKSRSTINEHILNIYEEQELDIELSMRKIGNTDFSTKPTNFYNLDVTISVGYRVKSPQGTKFRQWATARLREYIVKGFLEKSIRYICYKYLLLPKIRNFHTILPNSTKQNAMGCSWTHSCIRTLSAS